MESSNPAGMWHVSRILVNGKETINTKKWDKVSKKKSGTISLKTSSTSSVGSSYCSSPRLRLILFWYDNSMCCRLTLLLGPPGCGKSTLLRALAGKLDKSLKVQTLPFIINIRCLFSFSLIVSAPKDLRD